MVSIMVLIGELAQLVERLLSMQEVAGSIPAFSILPLSDTIVPQAKVALFFLLQYLVVWVPRVFQAIMIFCCARQTQRDGNKWLSSIHLKKECRRKAFVTAPASQKCSNNDPTLFSYFVGLEVDRMAY
jgi:hypothetical protein